MSDAPKILFLDAATYTGWAVGPAGQPPVSGSRFMAKKQGSSMPAVFWGTMRFISEMIQEHGKDLIIRIEEALPGSQVQGQTNMTTTRILHGIPACIMGMAYGLGCYDVDTIRVDTIRKHFIGKNMKGELAKPLVLKKCIALGWINRSDDDLSYDRSDALAGWSCAEHKLFPRNSQPIDDIFVKMQAKKAGTIV